MLKWNDLFLNGSVLDLDVRVWRARLQLTLADLGLEDSEEAHKALSLGCHRLAPHEAFEEVWKPAREAMALVDSNSVNFPMIEGARFVPATRLNELLLKLKDCQERFNESVAQFIKDYDAMQAGMLPIIEAALLKAAKDEATARKAFERVCSEYPNATDVRLKFGLTWKVFAITAASDTVAGAVEDEAAGVRDLVTSMVGELRTDLSTRLQEVMNIAVKGGKLNQRTIDATWALCDRVDNLNFAGDKVLAQQVRALRNLLGTLDKASVTGDDIAGFQAIKTAIETDISTAVAEAEYNLTALGRRRLEA